MALLSDGHDVIDKEYKELTAEMYAAGHSFFTYISDNPNALASCCRLRNEVSTNEFSFTNGLTGVATGSVCVITLNMNRIIQDWANSTQRKFYNPNDKNLFHCKENIPLFTAYLENILSRVYKYHRAYKDMLYESFKNGILPAYSAGYIDLHQQFSTVGINGMNEAAEFMGITCSDNLDYQEFCNVITSVISKDNKENTDSEIKFNLEFVPAESLGVKNYSWDKEDGYVVPENRNCYNSYFYKPDDPTIDILQKFRLQGSRYAENCDGGVAFHANLDEHLSKQQYLKLIDYSIKVGCNYFTFNIPNSECNDCGHIVKRPIKTCPECGSKHITWWTRIIGYLRPISTFSKSRQVEASRRVYLHANEEL